MPLSCSASQDVGVSEAIVEHAPTGADYCFWSDAFAAEAPGEGQARGYVGVIADVVLRFEAQAEAQRHVRAQAPIVLRVEAQIELIDFGVGISRGDIELAGAATHGDDLRESFAGGQTFLRDLIGFETGDGLALELAGAESEGAVEICVGVIRGLIGAKSSAEFQVMLA